MEQFRNLISGFFASVENFPSRPALVVGDDCFSYQDLGQLVSNIATTIIDKEECSNPLVAILASRSLTAYTGVLGILASEKGYVPLNPKFPIERTRKMLVRSGSDIVIVGHEGVQTLEAMLPHIDQPFTFILPEVSNVRALSDRFAGHRFISSTEISQGLKIPAFPRVQPESIAYLLFTSGSTGEPKGVPINQMNVQSYVQYVCNRYDLNEHDRVSQEFDMTFDLSVHDMFVCWECGACLYGIPERYVMAPAKFIRDQQLTVWFSVPSVIAFVSKMRMLKPGCFPSLRYSLFCGEPLPASSAQAWQEAAPNSIIENLYGPTEATIAISHYKWDDLKSPGDCVNGIVPIGWMFEGQRSCIIDKKRQLLSDGEIGELCLAGSQVTSGYWNNPEKTKEQFIRLPDFAETTWYRTGDLVKRDGNGCLYYLGRMDSQIKIRGYRVELQEIDHVLRKVSGTEQVVTIAWPVNNSSADGIVAFICHSQDCDKQTILAYCKQVLPEYMVPRNIYFVDEIPLNVNGKIDRLKLVKQLGSNTK